MTEIWNLCPITKTTTDDNGDEHNHKSSNYNNNNNEMSTIASWLLAGDSRLLIN